MQTTFHFAHSCGSTKTLEATNSFERYEKDKKSRIVSDVLEDIIHDENKVRPLRSCTTITDGQSHTRYYQLATSIKFDEVRDFAAEKSFKKQFPKKTNWEIIFKFN